MRLAIEINATRLFGTRPAKVLKTIKAPISISPVGHCSRVVCKAEKPNPLMTRDANYVMMETRFSPAQCV